MAIQTIIGLKRLADAKQRLSPHLSPGERRRLMVDMLSTVATVARDARLGPVALATSEPSAPMLAATLGVAVVSDGGLPWNQGLLHALALIHPRADAILYLAGDVPLVTVAELLDFVALAPPRGVAIARARDAGTNALLIRPPETFAPEFGRTHSSAVHEASARRLGLRCRLIDIPGLALDVDTIEDAWDAGQVPRPLSGTGPARARE